MSGKGHHDHTVYGVFGLCKIFNIVNKFYGKVSVEKLVLVEFASINSAIGVSV